MEGREHGWETRMSEECMKKIQRKIPYRPGQSSKEIQWS